MLHHCTAEMFHPVSGVIAIRLINNNSKPKLFQVTLSNRSIVNNTKALRTQEFPQCTSQSILPGRPVEHHPSPGARAPSLPLALGWPRSQAVSLHQLSQVRDPVISHPAPGTLTLYHWQIRIIVFLTSEMLGGSSSADLEEGSVWMKISPIIIINHFHCQAQVLCRSRSCEGYGRVR